MFVWVKEKKKRIIIKTLSIDYTTAKCGALFLNQQGKCTALHSTYISDGGTIVRSVAPKSHDMVLINSLILIFLSLEKFVFASYVTLDIYYPEKHIHSNVSDLGNDIVWNVGYNTAPYSQEIVEMYDQSWGYISKYQPWFMNLSLAVRMNSSWVERDHFRISLNLGTINGTLYIELSENWNYPSLTQCDQQRNLLGICMSRRGYQILSSLVILCDRFVVGYTNMILRTNHIHRFRCSPPSIYLERVLWRFYFSTFILFLWIMPVT